MSIGKQFTIGYIVLLALTVFVMLISYFRMETIQDRLNVNVQESIDGLGLASDVKYNIAMQGLVLREYLFIQDSENMAIVKESENIANDSIEKLMKFKSDEKQKEYIQELSTINAEFNKQTALLVEAVGKKLSKGQMDVLLGEATQLNNDTVAASEKIIDNELDIFNATKKESLRFATSSKYISLVVGIWSIVIIIYYILFVIVSIVKPINKMTKSIEYLAKGDFSQQDLIIRSNNELGMLNKGLNRMKVDIKKLVEGIATNATQLNRAIRDLSSNTSVVSKFANEISQQIEVVSSSTHESSENASDSSIAMTETAIGVERIANTSSELFDFAQNTNTLATDGAKILSIAKQQMAIISQSTHNSSQLISKLSQQTAQIQNMSKIITDITEQTNLLALNAAIEAARAGDQGKGFAVVAEEVRKLAEESKASASQIDQLTWTIQSDTADVAKSIKDGLEKTTEGVSIIEKAEISFKKIGQSVANMTEQLQDVTATSEQLSASTQEVSASISEIASHSLTSVTETDKIVTELEQQQTSLSTIDKTSNDLAEKAQYLTELTQQFKV
ncbi:methyl-accepting chemotaxis protein [Kurthia sibirica]|uniref:Methyl-accepting chemotaxis protein n=1 Tax=Kurthia sibirica TaxID=202750 RepID=A0A2U3ANE6_9BACL|nr:methyl-accepting chemotaxis protein [Kurthia sibirica]PWI26019.1 hypothetical protein DEX24_05680 [Kurthia sibirica]GEK34581.1 methyl-accepting chemotaxis protein [Kurthia sibirica]